MITVDLFFFFYSCVLYIIHSVVGFFPRLAGVSFLFGWLRHSGLAHRGQKLNRKPVARTKNNSTRSDACVCPAYGSRLPSNFSWFLKSNFSGTCFGLTGFWSLVAWSSVTLATLLSTLPSLGPSLSCEPLLLRRTESTCAWPIRKHTSNVHIIQL